jgi:hypothetical protein
MDTVAEARALSTRYKEENMQRARAEKTVMTKGTTGRRRSETPTEVITTCMTPNREVGCI